MNISVVGLGKLGAPLAAVLASKGFDVVGVDLNQTYVDALRANGRRAIVWDVATQGAPDVLGVLGHFRTVVHYTGAGVPGNATQLQLRAYLNEGGRMAQYQVEDPAQLGTFVPSGELLDNNGAIGTYEDFLAGG